MKVYDRDICKIVDFKAIVHNIIAIFDTMLLLAQNVRRKKIYILVIIR